VIKESASHAQDCVSYYLLTETWLIYCFIKALYTRNDTCDACCL